MDLFEAFERRLPLVVVVAPDNERLVGALFRRERGVAWADAGWPDATWQPFHVLEGKVSGEGPWQVGGTEIRLAVDGERLMEDWRGWREFRASEDGRRFTPAAAAAEARRRGVL